MYEFVFNEFYSRGEILTNDVNILDFLNTFFYHKKKCDKSICHFKLYIIKNDRNFISFDGNEKKLVSHENIFNHIITRLNDICIGAINNGIFFHAASFMIGEKLYIIPSSSGSGKTTFLSLMLKHKTANVYYISDDILMFNNDNKQILGLPCGLKIKKGTFDKFFSFSNEMYSYPSEGGRINIFLPDNEIIEEFDIIDFRNIVFLSINYDGETDFELERLCGTQCIELLLNNMYDIASGTFERLSKISDFNKSHFYKIRYSNDLKAIKEILYGNL